MLEIIRRRYPADKRFSVSTDDINEIAAEFEKSKANEVKRNNFDKWKKEMSEKDVYTFEAVASHELEMSGYETVCTNPHMTTLDRFYFEAERYWRLAKLNLYRLGVILPQDKPKWNKSKVRKLIQPGDPRELE